MDASVTYSDAMTAVTAYLILLMVIGGLALAIEAAWHHGTALWAVLRLERHERRKGHRR